MSKTTHTYTCTDPLSRPFSQTGSFQTGGLGRRATTGTIDSIDDIEQQKPKIKKYIKEDRENGDMSQIINNNKWHVIVKDNDKQCNGRVCVHVHLRKRARFRVRK